MNSFNQLFGQPDALVFYALLFAVLVQPLQLFVDLLSSHDAQDAPRLERRMQLSLLFIVLGGLLCFYAGWLAVADEAMMQRLKFSAATMALVAIGWIVYALPKVGNLVDRYYQAPVTRF